jgi:hypothetical protein
VSRSRNDDILWRKGTGAHIKARWRSQVMCSSLISSPPPPSWTGSYFLRIWHASFGVKINHLKSDTVGETGKTTLFITNSFSLYFSSFFSPYCAYILPFYVKLFSENSSFSLSPLRFSSWHPPPQVEGMFHNIQYTRDTLPTYYVLVHIKVQYHEMRQNIQYFVSGSNLTLLKYSDPLELLS